MPRKQRQKLPEVGTPEWHERRRSRLGASEVASVLGFNKWSTAWEVWAIKKGKLEPFEGNDATRLGHRLEPALLDQAEEDLDVRLVRQVEKVLDDDDLPLVATLDGIAPDFTQVETKTAGMFSGIVDDWGDPGIVLSDDQVPINYFLQTQAQLLCEPNSPRSLLYALLPKRGIVVYEIHPDPELHDWMKDRLTHWWQKHIVDGHEPTLNQSKTLSRETLNRINREPDAEIVVNEGPEAEAALRLIAERQSLKNALRDMKKRADEIDALLIQSLGEAESALLPGGSVMSYKTQTRRAYTVDEKQFRVLKIKEPKTGERNV